ncbi:hypothetical protein Tco_0535728, partial [Tanacetum coccineum]
NSTTEAKYVAAANCCGQVLWIHNQMLDYRFNFMNTKIYIDNERTITIIKNPKLHGKTKHIEIRHHFIRDCHEKRLIQTIKIHADHNVADLLTKAFDVSSCKVNTAWQDFDTAGQKLVPPGKKIVLLWVKGQNNPLIPNTHPLEVPITVLSSFQLNKTHKHRKAKRITKISQSSEPIHLIADETIYKEWEDRMERVATTTSSLEVEQDSGNINRT